MMKRWKMATQMQCKSVVVQHVPPTAPTFQPKDFLDTSGADTLPSYRAPPDLTFTSSREVVLASQLPEQAHQFHPRLFVLRSFGIENLP